MSAPNDPDKSDTHHKKHSSHHHHSKDKNHHHSKHKKTEKHQSDRSENSKPHKSREQQEKTESTINNIKSSKEVNRIDEKHGNVTDAKEQQDNTMDISNKRLVTNKNNAYSMKMKEQIEERTLENSNIANGNIKVKPVETNLCKSDKTAIKQEVKLEESSKDKQNKKSEKQSFENAIAASVKTVRTSDKGFKSDANIFSNGEKENSMHKEFTLKLNSSNSKSDQSSHKSHRLQPYHHREGNSSQSVPHTHKHEHHRNESKSEYSHHKKRCSNPSQNIKTNIPKTVTIQGNHSESKPKPDRSLKSASKEDADHERLKDSKVFPSDSQKRDSVGKSVYSSKTDNAKSHHRKKRIVNCGVQVNLRKKTDTKSVQVPCDNDTGSLSLLANTQKISEKKLQRIAFVQKSMTDAQKMSTGKNSKVMPRTGLENGCESTESVPLKFNSEFTTESQDNKMWKTEFASVDKYKFKRLMHVEQYSNGGGLVLHAYQKEVDELSDTEKAEFAKEYMDFVFGEPTEGVANCCMGIVHGAVSNMPDLIEHFADTYPNLTVKAGILGKSDIETMSLSKYREQLHNTFHAGTYRCGPLLQISVVGTAQEEVGDYFPDVLDMFESDPFLNIVMPWGELSSVRMASRNMSNDGPILWSRPGEQLLPTAELPKSPFKRKR